MNTEVMYCNVKQMVERLNWMADRSEKGVRQRWSTLKNMLNHISALGIYMLRVTFASIPCHRRNMRRLHISFAG
ncbi:hypothetical protein Peur_024523 [Populus x canadensis]